MLIDETKNALDNVWNLINDANGTSLTASSGFVLGMPVDNASFNRNTAVLVSATEIAEYQGTETVYYNRRGMLDNTLNKQTSFPVQNDLTAQALMDMVTAALHLVAAEVEFVEPFAFRMKTITLSPIANSLLYNTPQLITLVWPKPLITELITQPLLNGFDVLS